MKVLKEANKKGEIDEGSLLVNASPSHDYSLLVSDLKAILKENEFAIFHSHLIMDETFKEIAMRLGMKENTVKTIYFRTLEKCKKILKGGM